MDRPTTTSNGRRLLVFATLAAILGLFGAGAATGFWVNNTRIAHETAVTESSPAREDSVLPADSMVMPDVRGLTEEAARQVLADSTAARAVVETRTVPFSGLTGIVIDQQPAYGAPISGTVVVTVSAPAAVPEIAGLTEVQVRTHLVELGAELVVNRQYVPGANPGSVLGIEPPAGSPLPDIVTVVVADVPATAYLANIDTTRDGCGTGSYTQAGAEQDNALSCSVRDRPSTPPRGPLWEFGGAVEDVDLSFGLPTDSQPGSTVRVEVFADGNRVAEAEVAYGRTAKVAVPTPGALQFMIVLTAVAGDPERITVTGSVRGSRDGIVALTEEG
ncbi:PASTA domain-containing protein [Nocardia rhizosphaerae]|uniref:PASTA domain-containing protein n=1 Tax=Nocardia rhizosphaerae TaxID=1691571 RepID=A0ABV8LB52_9NOCA